MIYFGPDLMQRMIRQFHDCLVPGAWLLVGPSEPNMTYFSSFRTVAAPGVTLYQKPASELQESLVVNLPPSDEVNVARWPIDNRPQVVNLPHTPTPADVRRHADRGAWDCAARCCEQLLKTDNLNSLSHFPPPLLLP